MKFSGGKRVLQFYLIEKHIHYTKKSLNNLSANFNFLCDLKILSKMVPNGSNLMRFYITVKIIVACMGNIDTKGQGEQNEQQVIQFI